MATAEQQPFASGVGQAERQLEGATQTPAALGPLQAFFKGALKQMLYHRVVKPPPSLTSPKGHFGFNTWQKNLSANLIALLGFAFQFTPL